MSSNESKVLLFNSKFEEWPTFYSKAIADCLRKGNVAPLLLAKSMGKEKNDKGVALQNGHDDAKKLDCQGKVYGMLALGISESLPEVIARVDPLSDTAGTDLWEQLLVTYQSGANVNRARLVINLANMCLSFRGGKWSTHFGAIERLTNIFKAGGDNITVDEMTIALTLQGMILADGQWGTLATMLINDETLTLDQLRRRAYDHSVHHGHEQDRLNQDTVAAFTARTAAPSDSASVAGSSFSGSSDSTLVSEIRELKEALAAQARGQKGGAKKSPLKGKLCWYHKSEWHDASDCRTIKDGNLQPNADQLAWIASKSVGKCSSSRSRTRPNQSYSRTRSRQKQKIYSNSTSTLNAAAASTKSKTPTVLDTATDCHIRCTKDYCSGLHQSNVQIIGVDPNSPLTDTLEGVMNLPVLTDQNEATVITGKAIICEDMNKNLLCPADLLDDDIADHVYLSKKTSYIKLTKHMKSVTIPLFRKGKQWEIGTLPSVVSALQASLVQKPLTPRRDDNDELLMHYHKLYAHLNFKDVVRLSSFDLDMPILYMPNGKKKHLKCHGCMQKKLTGGAKKKVAIRRATTPLGRLFVDLAGPVRTQAIGGYRHFMVLVDDCTRRLWIYLLRQKSDACDAFKHFCTHYGKPEVLKSDNAPELKDGPFKAFTIESDIAREFCALHEKWANGVPERWIRTVSEAIRCMLYTAKLPAKFWGLAAEYLPELRNEAPTKANPGFLPPNRLWGEDISNTKFLKPFGCLAVLWRPPELRQDKRLGDTGVKGIFVGSKIYGGERVYKVYNPVTCKVHLGTIATFDEDVFPGLEDFDPSDVDQLVHEFQLPTPSSLQSPAETRDGVKDILLLSDPVDRHHIDAMRRENHPLEDPAPSKTAADLFRPAIPKSLAPRELPKPELSQSGPVHNNATVPNSHTTAPPSSPSVTRVAPKSVFSKLFEGSMSDFDTSLGAVMENISKPAPHVVRPSPNLLPPDSPNPSNIDSSQGEQSTNSPPNVEGKRLRSGKFIRSVYATTVTGTITVKSPNSGAKLKLLTPNNMSEVRASPQVLKWFEGIKDEMDGLKATGTYTKVKKTPGMRVIPTRFVFKVKTDEHGNVIKYKARLVAKGFYQQKGLDFTESYAPVSSATAIRVATAIATAHDLEMRHFDVAQAFLNAKIDGEVYVSPPDGDPDQSSKGFVCKLHRALYGLVQSPMLWAKTLRAFLEEIGFKVIGYEGSIYRLERDGQRIIIVTYVDDLQMLYHKDHEGLADEIIKTFNDKFKITDEGDLTWHLGIHYTRDRANRTTFLSQQKYVETILERFGYLDLNPVRTPAESDLKMFKAPDAELLSDAEASVYREQLGCLQYLASMTRPDLSYIVGQLA